MSLTTDLQCIAEDDTSHYPAAAKVACASAAAEIERLTAENERLRHALRTVYLDLNSHARHVAEPTKTGLTAAADFVHATIMVSQQETVRPDKSCQCGLTAEGRCPVCCTVPAVDSAFKRELEGREMTAHHCPSCPCPICHPNAQPWRTDFALPPQPVFYPPGCICPPTSEKTCENPTCPRRGIRLASGTGYISSSTT